MRIAFVTSEYVSEPSYDGGLANYLHRVSRGLAAQGHEPVVIVAADHAERLMHDGIQVWRVDVRPPVWLRWLSRVSLHRFARALDWLWQSHRLSQAVLQIHRENRLDLVQYAHLYGVGFYRSHRLPSVVRISAYQPLWQAKGEGGAAKQHGRHQYWLERRAMLRADAIFSPSQLLATAVQQDIERPVRVIESPFLPEAGALDDRPYRELLAGKTYLLFFGNLNPLKGLLTLADTLPELLRAHPDLWFVLIGRDRVGHNKAPMMDHVWQRAGECRGRILYLGRMHHDQLYPILRGAIAVVLPSRVDNLPNAALEAMAHGRVVIGTRGASFEQLISDGANGLLCEPDDPASLRAAIEQALDMTDTQRDQMGRAAVERIAQLAPAKALTQLLEFYQEVIRERAA